MLAEPSTFDTKRLDLTAMNRADDNRNQNDNSYDPFGVPGESGTGRFASFAAAGRLQSKQHRSQVDQSNTGADYRVPGNSSVV